MPPKRLLALAGVALAGALAPAIADSADWENGPTDLRGPHMPSWQPIVW